MKTSKELLDGLTPMDFVSRINGLRSQMPDDLDALLITHLTNVMYLTSYTGSNGALFITRDNLTFLTDGRYTTQSKEQLDAANIDAEIIVSAPGKTNLEYLKSVVGKIRVGLEADTLSWNTANKYIEAIEEATFVPTSSIVENLRKVKQPGEVDRIRAACRIADEALAEVKNELKKFPTEKEFAVMLDRKMKDLGAQANSFETIVACGSRAALPHATPTDAKIEPNSMIVIDFGCMVDGYCSDMTRTLSVGEVDQRQQEMFDNVKQSQKLGREHVRPGVKAGEVDAQCRNYLHEKGMAQYFAHGTGHGVGLDIHEAPRVGNKVEEVLQPGYIVTVEPGVYIEGFAGVRIEDTLAVTENGAEVLTSAPKDLVV